MRTNLSRKILLVTMLSVCGLVALAQQGKIDTSNLKVARVNPAAALGDDVAADDIFSSVEYIPLETTDKSLFGKIDQLDILDGKFVILDREAYSVDRNWVSSILIFDGDGRYRTRIDMRDHVRFITVDREKKEIIASTGELVSRYIYNIDGKLLRTEPWNFSFMPMVITPGGLTAVFKGYRADRQLDKFPSDIKHNTIALFKPGFKFLTAFIPFDTSLVDQKSSFYSSGDGRMLSYSGQRILVRQPHQFDIYELNEDKMEQKIRFIFPMANTVPSNFLFGPEYSKKVDFMNNKPTWIVDMRGVYQTGNILSVSLFFNHYDQTFFYNLKNNLLTSLVAIKPDHINVIVPMNNPIVASDGKLMYTWLKSAPFFAKQRSVSDIIKVDRELAMKLIKNGQTGIPIDPAADYKGKSGVLSKFLKEGSAKANPVLIALKVI